MPEDSMLRAILRLVPRLHQRDANGTELWTFQFGTTDSNAAFGISKDASGVYVTGSTTGGLFGQTPAGNSDAFVVKLVFQ